MILLRFCCCCCPTCTLYVGEGLDERSRVLSGLFGFISSLLMAGWRRLVTRRSSHATLDGALLAPSLHTMATNASHGPRNRFGWPRGPKFLSIASGGRVVLLCLPGAEVFERAKPATTLVGHGTLLNAFERLVFPTA